jgi:RHS repeat-associated protein
MKQIIKRSLIAVVALAALFSTIHAYAYDAPWNGWREDITGPGSEQEQDCESGECGPPGECNTGSPVYTARGYLVWSDTDIHFPGATRIGLKRIYNSFDFRAGMFGRGWFTAQESNIARTQKAISDDSADGGDDGLPTIARAFKSTPVWMSSYGRRYILEESATVCTPPRVFFFTFEKQSGGSFKQVFEDSRSYAIYSRSGVLQESYSDESGETIYYDYDAQQRLIYQHDSYGNSLAFSYNERGFVDLVIDQAGRQWSYSYDDYGNLVQVVDPDNNSRDYAYLLVDKKGYKQQLLNSVHDNLDKPVLSVSWRESTLYNRKAMRVSSYTGRDGRRHDYSYVQTSYSGAPAVRAVKNTRQVDSNAIIESRTYISDAHNYWILQHTNNTRGTTWQRAYNDRGRMTWKRDERGNVTSFEYNDAGRITRVTEMAGTFAQRVIAISYFDDTNRIAVINEYGVRETRYTYDSDLRRISTTRIDLATGVQRSTNYSYHANSSDDRGHVVLGQLASMDGPQPGTQDRYAYFYNQQGLLSRVDLPLGHSLSYAYNTAGQLQTATDANGVTTSMVFDSSNRLLQLRREGLDIYYAYTVQGEISKITDELGRVTTLSYNGHGEPAHIIYPSGDYLSFSYVYASAYTEVTRRYFSTQRYSLTGGRLISTSVSRHDPVTGLPQQSSLATVAEVAAQHQYSGVNDLLQTTLYGQFGDTTGVTSSIFNYLYDGEGRLKQVRDGLNGVTLFSHDLFDRITQVTDANGGATQYNYSIWNELIQSNSPDNGSSGYGYDPAGNLVSEIDANGMRTSYSYDALNRPTGIDYAGDALDTTFGYDGGAFGKGRLTSVVDGSGISRYYYDERGLLLQSSTTIGRDLRMYATTTVAGRSLDVSYSYDDAGELTGIGYPSGAQLSFSHDSAGRLSAIEHNNGKVTALLDNISWSGPNMTGYQQGNGITTELLYDSSGRLIEKRYGGSSNSLQIVLDRQGQITRQSWSKDGNSETSSFLYDHLGRIQQDGGLNEAFSYDAAGNRLTSQKDGSSDSYSYDANSNRLNQVEATAIQRDAAGNRLGDGVRRYQYNAMNRLAQVNSSQTQIQAAYSYNYQGQRVRKELAGAQAADIRYIYGQDGELLGEYDSDGNVVREYIYLGDGTVKELIAQVEADGSIVTIHSDHLATPRLATAEDQTVVWRWNSDAFGTTDADEDPDGDGSKVVVNHRFPGQYYDLESGLHYNHFRYYDPQTGRYISSDPIGLAGGFNTFSYVGGNPLNNGDPSGLLCGTGVCVWALYTAIEIGMAIYDAYDTADTITDDCASTGEKILAGGLFMAGAFLPGGGYGMLDDARVFWSGPGARKAAEAFAKENGAKTLEMTIPGKVLDKITTPGNFKYLKPLWNAASRNFAKGARGPVDVFHSSKGVRIESVWGRKEYPILKKRGNPINYHVVY